MIPKIIAVLIVNPVLAVQPRGGKVTRARDVSALDHHTGVKPPPASKRGGMRCAGPRKPRTDANRKPVPQPKVNAAPVSTQQATKQPSMDQTVHVGSGKQKTEEERRAYWSRQTKPADQVQGPQHDEQAVKMQYYNVPLPVAQPQKTISLAVDEKLPQNLFSVLNPVVEPEHSVTQGGASDIVNKGVPSKQDATALSRCDELGTRMNLVPGVRGEQQSVGDDDDDLFGNIFDEDSLPQESSVPVVMTLSDDDDSLINPDGSRVGGSVTRTRTNTMQAEEGSDASSNVHGAFGNTQDFDVLLQTLEQDVAARQMEISERARLLEVAETTSLTFPSDTFARVTAEIRDDLQQGGMASPRGDRPSGLESHRDVDHSIFGQQSQANEEQQQVETRSTRVPTAHTRTGVVVGPNEQNQQQGCQPASVPRQIRVGQGQEIDIEPAGTDELEINIPITTAAASVQPDAVVFNWEQIWDPILSLYEHSPPVHVEPVSISNLPRDLQAAGGYFKVGLLVPGERPGDANVLPKYHYGTVARYNDFFDLKTRLKQKVPRDTIRVPGSDAIEMKTIDYDSDFPSKMSMAHVFKEWDNCLLNWTLGSTKQRGRKFESWIERILRPEDEYVTRQLAKTRQIFLEWYNELVDKYESNEKTKSVMDEKIIFLNPKRAGAPSENLAGSVEIREEMARSGSLVSGDSFEGLLPGAMDNSQPGSVVVDQVNQVSDSAPEADELQRLMSTNLQNDVTVQQVKIMNPNSVPKHLKAKNGHYKVGMIVDVDSQGSRQQFAVARYNDFVELQQKFKAVDNFQAAGGFPIIFHFCLFARRQTLILDQQQFEAHDKFGHSAVDVCQINLCRLA